MTIGPAPMIRMLWMSVRFPTRLPDASMQPALLLFGGPQLGLQPPQHQLREALKERLHIVRPGTRLGMSLEAERRAIAERDALQRSVEERAMCGAYAIRKGGLIDRETVVLARDEDASAIEVLDRMVRAVMAEFHFYAAAAGREPEDLVTQADAEDRQFGREQLSGGLDRV